MILKHLRFYILFISWTLLSGFNKSIVLPSSFNVYYVQPTSITKFPSSAFPPFNSDDAFEELVFPKYVSNYSDEQIAINFKKSLKSYLAKKKIHLVDQPSTYELKIVSINYTESNNRIAYIDSCKILHPSKYAYYSDLKVTVQATLMKGSIEIGNWTLYDTSHERVKSTPDACNRPNISSPLFNFPFLSKNVARKLQQVVTKKITEVEG